LAQIDVNTVKNIYTKTNKISAIIQISVYWSIQTQPHFRNIL